MARLVFLPAIVAALFVAALPARAQTSSETRPVGTKPMPLAYGKDDAPKWLAGKLLNLA